MKILFVLLLSTFSSLGALFFNGSTANLQVRDVNDEPPVSMTGAHVRMSISCWCRLTTTNISPIVSKHNTSVDTVSYSLIFNRSTATTNALTFYYTSGGIGNRVLFVSTPSFYPNTNVWFHVGFIYDVDNSVAQFYLNGSRVSGGFTSGTFSNPDAVAGYYYLGCDGIGGTFFSGQISEYNQTYLKAITSRQMEILAKSRIKGIANQIVTSEQGLLWKMNDLPAGYTGSVTNSVFDSIVKSAPIVTNVRKYTPGSPVGGPIYLAEHVCSYPPNE